MHVKNACKRGQRIKYRNFLQTHQSPPHKYSKQIDRQLQVRIIFYSKNSYINDFELTVCINVSVKVSK